MRKKPRYSTSPIAKLRKSFPRNSPKKSGRTEGLSPVPFGRSARRVGSITEGGEGRRGAKAQAAAGRFGVCGLWTGTARELAAQSRRFSFEERAARTWIRECSATQQDARGLLECRACGEAPRRLDAA